MSAASCAVCGATEHSVFLRKDPYAIVTCAQCGFRYLNPEPSAAELDRLYGESYFRNDDSVAQGYASYEAEADNWRATFRDRLLLFPTTAGRRLLDVGAATGFFVEQARAAGWDAEGVEPSEWAARYAREQLGQPVRTGTLDEAGVLAAAYDVVTMWEVIEHLPDVGGVLRDVARVLKPGGYLLLSTPDAGSVAARLSGKRWLGWRKIPEHLSYFDGASLRRVLGDAGFDVESTRYVSLTVTWGFALQRLSALTGAEWLARAPKWVADRRVRVNPRYDLMVTARRR